jgi:peroxiredoxin
MTTVDVEPARRPVQSPKRREGRGWPWKPLAGAGGVAVLLAASFLLPPLFQDDQAAAPAGSSAVPAGEGPELGSAIPFAEQNVITGAPISSDTLSGQKTLLYFSEGVMCQACFVQIRDLEALSTSLEDRGIALVSITPDPPNVLRQAITHYGLTTPMIADENRDMSTAFNTLGKGMHPDTPGHAFALLDEEGAIIWYRDYWLHPYRTMYVEPSQLLADIPRD